MSVYPFNRVRSGRAVQNRSVTEARAHSSNACGLSGAAERTLDLHQAMTGFCKQALSAPKTLLGPGRRLEPNQFGTVRLCYVPSS
jgi:hypothetical protein